MPTGLTTIGSWNAYVHDPQVAAPIIIAFHGNGEANSQGGVNAILREGFPKALNAGWRPSVPVFIVCPQGGWGSFEIAHIPYLVDAIKVKYPLANFSKLYVTGYSAGTSLTLQMASYRPLAIFPLSPVTATTDQLNVILNNRVPTHIWAGSAESTYLAEAQRIYTIVKDTVTSSLTIRNGVGHSGWSIVYQSSAFWSLISTSENSVNAGPDITTTNPTFTPPTIPGGTWTLVSSTAPSNTYAFRNGTLFTMGEGDFVFRLTVGNQYDEMKLIYRRPTVVMPQEVYSLVVEGQKIVLYTHPQKNYYTGSFRYNITLTKTNGSVLTINKDGTWSER